MRLGAALRQVDSSNLCYNDSYLADSPMAHVNVLALLCIAVQACIKGRWVTHTHSQRNVHACIEVIR